ncbi:MAG: hypothetical protein Q9191_003550 [Dirinaria sp. TL-2023a]
MRRLTKELSDLLKPLTSYGDDDEPKPIDSEVFVKYGVITEPQRESLIEELENWFSHGEPMNDLETWLGRDLIPFVPSDHMPLFAFVFEEMDLEYEQLQEMEAEAKADEDEDFDTLRGHAVRLDEPFIGNKNHTNFTDEKIEELLQEQDLHKIPRKYRGPIYRWMQRKLKGAIRDAFRQKARQHTELVQQLKIGRWEIESNFLEQAKIVGMTTTGLSKYRGLLQSVKPKIVMIEEAAETLEAFVTAACMDTIEHIILVGDHQQLRGHCSVPDLEGVPFFLDVSMFERFVVHTIGHTQLQLQRRMIPEIRRIVMPIYPGLKDHPSVLQREPVPGMGGVNSYLFVHNWLEDADSQFSKVNVEEARMLVAFYNYLVDAGVKTPEISVLTFYNGQRKLILRSLRRHPNLQGHRFKVATVDAYQGEENGIVLLSLVRNNQNANIGFLSVINRVCVALSRAQRGFYIFGNAHFICRLNVKWFELVQAMGSNPKRLGYHLPITCDMHHKKQYFQKPEDFDNVNGGCSMPCNEELPCGHLCPLFCHSDAAPPDAGMPAVKLPSGPSPGGSRSQSQVRQVNNRSSQTNLPAGTSSSQMSAKQKADRVEEFQEFAQGGHFEADKKLDAAANKEVAVAVDEDAKRKLQKLDDEMAAALFGDLDDAAARTDSPKKQSLSPKKKEGVVLVRRSPDGRRGVWRGTYDPMVKSEDEEKKEFKGFEKSLLD